MKLSLQNFSALVEGMAASVQGAATTLLDLTVGSVLRAILEANASVVLWLQWLIVQTLSATRLATSSGTDCDSFGADFGFARLPAVAASGQVVFSRFTPSLQALIPVGSSVTTATSAQSFLVVADQSNPAYDAVQGGYVLATNISSVNALVVAANPGAAGNVQPGTISLLNSAIAGVDTVTNLAVLTGGLDAESDAAFKARFGTYLAGLSKATNAAIGSAVSAIMQGLSYSVVENINQAGQVQMGHFVVTVDDGTGDPPANLLATVQQAVDTIRPVGTSFAVQGPVVTLANVAMTLTTDGSTDHAQAVAAVASAVETYIAALPVGDPLSYMRLAQLAYDGSDSVTNISGLLLSGAAADLTPGPFGAVRPGVIAVS